MQPHYISSPVVLKKSSGMGSEIIEGGGSEERKRR
jgi:hypothetical protein